MPPPPHAHNAHTHTHTYVDPEHGDIFRSEIGRLSLTPSETCNSSSTAGSSISTLAQTSTSISTTAKMWLTAERLGVHARSLHRFLEWDGWEEGLLDNVLAEYGRAAEVDAMLLSPTLSATTSPPQSPESKRDGRGNGTFKMKNGFIGLSLT